MQLIGSASVSEWNPSNSQGGGIETISWITLDGSIGRIHLSLKHNVISSGKKSEIAKKKQQEMFVLTNNFIVPFLPMKSLIKR